MAVCNVFTPLCCNPGRTGWIPWEENIRKPTGDKIKMNPDRQTWHIGDRLRKNMGHKLEDKTAKKIQNPGKPAAQKRNGRHDGDKRKNPPGGHSFPDRVTRETRREDKIKSPTPQWEEHMHPPPRGVLGLQSLLALECKWIRYHRKLVQMRVLWRHSMD